jgi:hypothetical protein
MLYFVFLSALSAIAMLSTSNDIDKMQFEIDRLSDDITQIELVGNALNRYLLTEGALPTTLTALAATLGYETITPFINDMGYSMVTLDDTTLDVRYQKAIVFYKFDLTETDATFLNTSDCGTGDFSSNSQWCKRDSSPYAVIDERDYQRYLATESIVKLDRLGQQIFNARTLNDDFPRTHPLGTLSDGDLITIHEAAGYSGTVGACNGIFNFDGAILSCELMFGLNGAPIQYLINDSSLVVLYINMPYVSTSGSTLRTIRILETLD